MTRKFQPPHLLYGGDYNPEQWLDRPDLLKEDIRLLKLAGCNTVTLGVFSWSVLEPEEGQYDTAWLEETVERLYQNGIFTILSTPSGARPKWLSDRYPEVLRTDAQRRKHLWGTRHNHCLTSPLYREKVAQIDRLLSQRLGSHPGVILWHISNELGGECHCPLCQSAFQDWLRDRYDSIDTLNQRWNTTFWSHRYNSFSQIESPSPIGEDQLHALKLNWNRFVTELTAAFVRWEAQAIREGGSELPITTNFMYYFGGLDYFRLAKELDVVSWDTYPTWHKGIPETAYDNGMCHDLMRSLKRAPFLQMESCLTSTNWQGISRLKPPGLQLAQTMQAIAHGADAAMFFQVRQSRGSSEKFHGALIDHYGGEDTRVYQEAKEGGAMLQALQALTGSRVVSQMAILYDWENQWAMEDAQGPRNNGLPGKELQLAFYKAARRKGWNVDLIDETCELEQLQGYRIVVLPMMYLLREPFAEALKAYVKGGGIVIGSFWSGIVDEEDTCYLGGTPHALTDLFGLRFEEIDALPDGGMNHILPDGADLEFDESDRQGETAEDSNIGTCVGSFERSQDHSRKNGGLGSGYSSSQLCELVRLQGASSLLVYGDDFYAGHPALTVHSYGKGQAWYLAAYAAESFYEDLLTRIETECKAAGCPIPKPVSGAIPCGLEITTRETTQQRFLIYQNFAENVVSVPLPDQPYEVLWKRGYDENQNRLNRFGILVLRQKI